MTELQLADWRRHVFALYAAVREEDRPAAGHQLWREGRDRLFREHPQSPLASGDPLRTSGLAYWPYDPLLRFELPLTQARERLELALPSGDDGTTQLRRVGQVQLPHPVESTLDVSRRGLPPTVLREAGQRPLRGHAALARKVAGTALKTSAGSVPTT